MAMSLAEAARVKALEDALQALREGRAALIERIEALEARVEAMDRPRVGRPPKEK